MTTKTAFRFAGRFIIGWTLLALLTAADSPPMDLGPALQPIVARYSLPGAVGAIMHGDKIVALGSTGIRKVGDPTPFLPTDTIHLGSDTKAMTAVLIGRLIDRGQLTFDAAMRDVFPEFAGSMDPQMAGVTVRQLLDHDAGLPHDLDWQALQRSQRPLAIQRRMAAQQALSAPPATPIGTYSYSNLGFVVLGAIIEARTGKPWEEVIRKEIFAPLDMTTAGFGPPGTRGQVDQPWGHILQNGVVSPLQADNAPVMGPASTVHCSMLDWCKFIAESMRSAQGHPTLVSAATYRQLISPTPGQEYAGGWIVTQRPWAGGPALTHAGSNTLWYCSVWIAPKKDFALLFATNDGSPPVATAADQAIGILLQFNSRMGTTR
jgi:CubicO group peptidase (beta-lactamase class C family)